MITTDNYTSLKGKYFNYLSGTYLCKDIVAVKYGNYRIETNKKTLVVNAAAFGDIIPLEPHTEEAQTAARLSSIQERSKKRMNLKLAPVSRRKSKRRVDNTPKEHIDSVFNKVSSKREMKPLPEPKVKAPVKKRLKDVVKSIKIFKSGAFAQWEDDLMNDPKNDMATLVEKLERTPTKIYARRWYLSEREKKGTKPRAKKADKAEKVGKRGVTSQFTAEQDALILSTGSERGAMKRLAERLKLPKTKVIARKLYLNKKKKEENMEYLEYKIGNPVKDQYGDEGVIVDIENALFKSVYVVQIVNVKSPHKVFRGMKRRYGKGTLEKIEKISPK